jgi:MFS family permease
MATTSNVQTFCAAQVFYSIGFVGTIFSIDVMTADSSKLRHRGLAFAFTSSPYIITALAGPKAAEGFYENISWRWAFGCFAIILPFVATPLFLLLLKNERKAKKNGLLVKTPSGRTLPQSIWYYFIEFDGMFSRAKKRALCD